MHWFRVAWETAPRYMSGGYKINYTAYLIFRRRRLRGASFGIYGFLVLTYVCLDRY